MAGPPHQPSTLSRRRPAPSGDEEATSQLKLGDFTNDYCLSVSECNELLRRLAEKDRAAGRPPSSNDNYVKTREYCAMFARFKDQNAVTQVDAISSGLMERWGLSVFEKAQLATLCCDTAEEARTLVPSLVGKIDDESLQAVLDDISKLRDFS